MHGETRSIDVLLRLSNLGVLLVSCNIQAYTENWTQLFVNFPNKNSKIDSIYATDGSYNGARIVFLVCGKTQNYAEK